MHNKEYVNVILEVTGLATSSPLYLQVCSIPGCW